MREIELKREMAMDVVCLTNGSFYPLDSFIGKEDYLSILNDMKTKKGEVWPLPIILLQNRDIAESLSIGEEIILNYDNKNIAKMQISEIFTINKEDYCRKIFGTLDRSHPGVEEIMNGEEYAISGTLKLINNPFKREYELSPKEVRDIMNKRDLKTMVAFHTRNPIHKSHEFLQRSCLEHTDALLVHPVIGKKKKGDFNEKYIIESYKIMINKFYPKNKVIFSTLSTYSRYAGPREAIFTALIRRNFGATHFIVGRDHTGVGNFYGKYDSQKIFDNLGDIGIEIIKFHAPSYCKLCKLDVTDHTCEHENEKVEISGTRIREMLKEGIIPPEEIMRKDISEMLIKAIKNGEEVFVK